MYKLVIILGFSSFLTVSSTIAQNCTAKSIEDFYNCYGGQGAFKNHSIKAISTFIESEDAIQRGDYALAKVKLDELFKTYPKGTNAWWNVWNDVNGSNIGSPHGYYGLRMMEDIVNHHLNPLNSNIEVQSINMTVVLVGCSKGIQPTNLSELQNGSGSFVTNILDPKMKEDNYRIIKQSYDLFMRYVHAITKGHVKIEVNFIELPQLCLDVSVTKTKPYLAYGPLKPVWDALSKGLKDSTDFWMINYPSHVPENSAFDNESFITGGMGADSKGGPVFIADDKWIIRKPAHLGVGAYSDIERRMYIPQWYQHEFFHHLFRIYPEYNLEVNGHDWFNKNFWPSDFDGQFETDYYTEALHKRIQTSCIPLATRLITRISHIPTAQFNKLSIDELIGNYSFDNIQNDWHEGEIRKQGNKYYWRNKANVQWEVTPNIAVGKLTTGQDCPYPGQDFFLELYKTIDGRSLPGVTALTFNGGKYKKRFNLLRQTTAFEIALGDYTRVPNQFNTYKGTIVKESGKLIWKSNQGDNWVLTPNALNESFSLNSGSPFSGEEFELIFSEDICELHLLGFKFQGYYYWKEKREIGNTSPILVNPLPDLVLNENFNLYTIDLLNVFSDPEGDPLQYFVSNNKMDTIQTTINNKILSLKGTKASVDTIYVMAIDQNGGLVTDEFTVIVSKAVSLFDTKLEQILVYPNPVDNFLIVKSTSDSSFKIINHLGQMVYTQKIFSGETIIDTKRLNSGIYILQTLSGQVFKFAKN